MERTLVLIKPDAMQRDLAGTIIARLEKLGMKLVALKMLHPDKALDQRPWPGATTPSTRTSPSTMNWWTISAPPR